VRELNGHLTDDGAVTSHSRRVYKVSLLSVFLTLQPLTMAHKVCEHSNYALSGLLRHPGITDRSQQPSAPATGTKPTPLDWVSASLVTD
jgi:hypothetical protein